MEIERSQPPPDPAKRPRLGAQYEGAHTRFAVRSSVAEHVELCLFDPSAHGQAHELALETGRERRVQMQRDPSARDRFACVLEAIAPGQLYGYRVHGPYAPRDGHRCNPRKLLLDPYALAIHGDVVWSEELFGGTPADPDVADRRDSAPFMPRSVVVDESFDWTDDAAPRTPWQDTFIYELHVKSWSARNPLIPPELRGTYAGLAHPASIEHLRALGVTAVELLPIHAFLSEQALVARGLRNHWGYNSLGYLAPHAAYAAYASGAQSSRTPGSEVLELKHAIRALHAAGIEVILDVVYNHTAETGHVGPTLNLRGFDNAAYYLLNEHDRRLYVDWTGCGNTLNARHSLAQDLILDSLRYWVSAMHVDGFRFDLASALLRNGDRVDMHAPLLEQIHADPVLANVKLIAEPWDCGAYGYQVGGFPARWSEWNGRYRDDVRDHWRAAPGALGQFATRVRGSDDLYSSAQRSPRASINFVTSHDGFTLRDLVTYEGKRNAANGEHNQDGERDNRSFNCGVEGETQDPQILTLRAQQLRNFLGTLFLSAGVPMLTAGDELGRTQRGNNNAYCQDNEISWLDWEHADPDLLSFVQQLVALRGKHAVLRPEEWSDVRHSVYRADGLQMTHKDWTADGAHAMGILIESTHAREPVTGLYLFVNAGAHVQRFTLPASHFQSFRHLLDTAHPSRSATRDVIAPYASLHVSAHAMRVLEGIA